MRMVAALPFVLLVAFARGQCPSNGLAIAVSGGRLGDAYMLSIAGSPSVNGLLAFDLAGGPTATPVGPVCLGLTPALQFAPFTLDAGGILSVAGVLPPAAGLIGLSVFLQAAAADVTIPGGLAISNDAHTTLRPPRIIFYNPGYFGPFGFSPGSFCIYDAMTDVATSGAIPLPGNVVHAVNVPALGAVAFLLGNGAVQLVDAGTGATITTLSIPTTPGFAGKLVVDETTLYAIYPGTAPSPFSGGSPGALRSFSLPSGAPGITTQLSAGNPNDLMIVPSTNLGYLRLDTSVVVIDLVSGPIVTTVSLGASSGSIVDWVLFNSVIYCLLGGTTSIFGGGLPPGFNAINTLTFTPVFPAPVVYPVTPPVSMLRIGPGSTANPSVFAYFGNAGVMVEVSIFNFGLLSAIPVGPGIIDMRLSTGGTQWLLLCNGNGCNGVPELQAITPPFMLPSTVTPLLPNLQTFLAPLPSTTLRKAFLLFGTSDVVPFQTDPAILPSSYATLPLSGPYLSAVID